MTFDLLRVSQAKHLGNRANLSLISKVFRLVFFSCILFVFFLYVFALLGHISFFSLLMRLRNNNEKIIIIITTMATHSLSQQTLATWILAQSNELQKSAGQPKEI